MDKEEKQLVREMVTLTKSVVNAMAKDHDTVVKTALRTEKLEESTSKNWEFTRRWVFRLGMGLLAIGVYTGFGEKILKYLS